MGSQQATEIQGRGTLWIKEGDALLMEVSISSLRCGSRRKDKRRLPLDFIKNIQEHGILNPLLCYKIADGKYIVIDGFIRWQAAEEIGLKRVPIRLYQDPDTIAMKRVLFEQLKTTAHELLFAWQDDPASRPSIERVACNVGIIIEGSSWYLSHPEGRRILIHHDLSSR